MTDEQWVKKLNDMAREMDAVCDSIHPSGWASHTEVLRKEWKQLAKTETNDGDVQALADLHEASKSSVL